MTVDRSAVEGVDERCDRLEHDRPHRDRLDEVAVTDIEMEDARPGTQEHLDLLADDREVGCIERRLDLGSTSPRIDPGQA